MVGHQESPNYSRLDLNPWDPECARAMLTRQPLDSWHDRCPWRGPMTFCVLQNYVSGGSIGVVKDHSLKRYEGYLLVTLGMTNMGTMSAQKAVRHNFRFPPGTDLRQGAAACPSWRLPPAEELPKEKQP